MILLLEKLFLSKYLEKIPKIFRWLYSFLLINIGWIIFRIESLSGLKNIFGQLIKFKSSSISNFLSENYELLNKVPFIILGLVFSFPVIKKLDNKFKNTFTYIFIKDVCLVLILMLSVFFLINDSYNPFIYFRF